MKTSGIKTGKCLMVLQLMAYLLFSVECLAKSPDESEKKSSGNVTMSTAYQADLYILGIHASGCKCDLADVDALYMGTIEVFVGKNDISTPMARRTEASAVVGFLTVKYFDLLKCKEVESTTALQNIHVNKLVTAVPTPVLIKRSVGVTATVKLNAPGYADTDPNMANNTKKVNQCVVYLH